MIATIGSGDIHMCMDMYMYTYSRIRYMYRCVHTFKSRLIRVRVF
jgi:hypothetical protein